VPATLQQHRQAGTPYVGNNKGITMSIKCGGEVVGARGGGPFTRSPTPPIISVTTLTISGTTAVQVDVSIPWKSLTGFGFLHHPDRVSSRSVMRYQ
jgi:hypothetical protein